MKKQLDMDKIAHGLGAKRGGTISSTLQSAGGDITKAIAIILGHELGHAALGFHDVAWEGSGYVPSSMRLSNILHVEDPLRLELKLPLRLSYNGEFSQKFADAAIVSIKGISKCELDKH